MITADEEASILKRAYVPEHIVSLMRIISKGDPFLIEDHVGFAKDNWLIFVGYPLDQPYSRDRCERIVRQLLETSHGEILWFIGPEVPPSLLNTSTERETDYYYALDIDETKLKSSLRRVARKAAEQLTVERSKAFSKEHEKLVAELLKREEMTPRVRELYRAIPDYVAQSTSACVLSARDTRGKLSAFYVLELAAEEFTTYVLGSYSRKNYVSHASDLLFHEMIELTREHGKKTINLGLGVNAGIRRFKTKWGGVPFLAYEFCEYRRGTRRPNTLMRLLEGKL
jgi:hypothetical protein